MKTIRVCVGIDLGRRSRHKALLAAPAFSESIELPKRAFSGQRFRIVKEITR